MQRSTRPKAEINKSRPRIVEQAEESIHMRLISNHQRDPNRRGQISGGFPKYNLERISFEFVRIRSDEIG